MKIGPLRGICLSTLVLVALGCAESDPQPDRVNLSPEAWPEGEYESFMAAQESVRSSAGFDTGYGGAVTVAYNGLAARAGLEALKQGGNAIDAAMTAAMAQVALTAGAPISYFGIMSLVYYHAETDRVYTMNAEWNTPKEELDPLSIPGGISFASEDGLRGMGEASGRTALVGGFMKGVGAAHERFGRLPFEELFAPSIYIAEQGMEIGARMAGYFAFRPDDLARLPETKAIFFKEDGSLYQEGDVFRQPQLAATLRAIAEQGTDYMYTGPWAEKLVALVRADGGKMTLEDLASYEVIWDEPLVAEIGGGYSLYTNPEPNAGGVGMVEAQNLALVSGLVDEGHWTESGTALQMALDITGQMFAALYPEEALSEMYPDVDFSNQSRVTREHAEAMWAAMQSGAKIARWESQNPGHSDDVVVIDRDGNIAAITHSINTVLWGKTAIFVDGVSIADAASFQQAAMAQIPPGSRLPAPTQTGVLFKHGEPVLGFASMGSGLHHRTFQGLLNYTMFGMNVEEAINTPDFFYPSMDPETFEQKVAVPADRFDPQVLLDMGYAFEEIPMDGSRFAGEGIWVAISRDPDTGLLEAASHNRNNSAALALPE